jgi:hypothetical protein
MTAGVRLHLDPFGREALASQAGGCRAAGAVVETAVRYYLADRGSGRPAWPVPRLARGERAGEREVVEVELGEGALQALAREADRQGCQVELLARHALLYYLADLESGRPPASTPPLGGGADV